MPMLDLSKIRESLLNPELSEAKIISFLKEISFIFTQKREDIEKVYKDEDFISAYACFFILSNMQKMHYLLDQLDSSFKSELIKTRLVEVGTGPGTYIFSLLDYFQDKDLELVGADSSELMLEQARKIQKDHYENKEVLWSNKIPQIDRDSTLIFGNSLNEMKANKAAKMIRLHDAKNVILIEPGTKQGFSDVIELRRKLINLGYNSLYPCQSNFNCPIMTKKQDDWCHQVVKTTYEQDYERLCQLISKDRRTMPVTMHVLTKSEVIRDSKATVIRLYKSLKHAFLWEVCLKGEKSNRKVIFEVSKKQFSKKEIKEFEKTSSGFEINYEVEKEIEKDKWRVKISR